MKSESQLNNQANGGEGQDSVCGVCRSVDRGSVVAEEEGARGRQASEAEWRMT
jgi:hypothetical protein